MDRTNCSPIVLLCFCSPKQILEMDEEQENGVACKTPWGSNLIVSTSFIWVILTLQVGKLQPLNYIVAYLSVQPWDTDLSQDRGEHP
jgi:hypothetical protein